MVVRLRDVQYHMDVKRASLEYLVEKYVEWRDYREYCAFLKVDEVEHRSVVQFSLCAKRGNDRYVWQIRKRFGGFSEERMAPLFAPLDKFKRSNMLLVTLTWGSGLGTIKEAWRNKYYCKNCEKVLYQLVKIRVWSKRKSEYVDAHGS